MVIEYWVIGTIVTINVLDVLKDFIEADELRSVQ